MAKVEDFKCGQEPEDFLKYQQCCGFLLSHGVDCIRHLLLHNKRPTAFVLRCCGARVQRSLSQCLWLEVLLRPSSYGADLGAAHPKVPQRKDQLPSLLQNAGPTPAALCSLLAWKFPLIWMPGTPTVHREMPTEPQPLTANQWQPLVDSTLAVFLVERHKPNYTHGDSPGSEPQARFLRHHAQSCAP